MLNIFSYTFFSVCGLCFHSLMSNVHKKFLIVIKSKLSIFSFMDFAFSLVFQNSPTIPRSPRFPLVFSFRSLIVMHFTINLMVHFELVFMKDVKFVPRYIFYI